VLHFRQVDSRGMCNVYYFVQSRGDTEAVFIRGFIARSARRDPELVQLLVIFIPSKFNAIVLVIPVLILN